MEPLHKLFREAQEMGLLGQIAKSCEIIRISLYADDVAVFIRPLHQELEIIQHILTIFAEASGLKNNLGKTEFYLYNVKT
jgi:hypothetical protein